MNVRTHPLFPHLKTVLVVPLTRIGGSGGMYKTSGTFTTTDSVSITNTVTVDPGLNTYH